ASGSIRGTEQRQSKPGRRHEPRLVRRRPRGGQRDEGARDHEPRVRQLRDPVRRVHGRLGLEGREPGKGEQPREGQSESGEGQPGSRVEHQGGHRGLLLDPPDDGEEGGGEPVPILGAEEPPDDARDHKPDAHERQQHGVRVRLPAGAAPPAAAAGVRGAGDIGRAALRLVEPHGRERVHVQRLQGAGEGGIQEDSAAAAAAEQQGRRQARGGEREHT
ncbi:hypothetical protein THAOC_14351, partial [Thalassiosira oceanica]